MKTRNLSVPMTGHDFEQLTLLANLMSVLGIVLKREKNGPRKTLLAVAKSHIERAERMYIGHLDGQSIEASTQFYLDMESALHRYLQSAKEGK